MYFSLTDDHPGRMCANPDCPNPDFPMTQEPGTTGPRRKYCCYDGRLHAHYVNSTKTAS